MTTSAIVLAAGESRRMGTPKMLLPWEGGTVLGSVVGALLQAPIDRVAVVFGHRSVENAAALGALGNDPRVIICRNERYQDGMLTSIQCGVGALGDGNILVALGDQPLITTAVVEQILTAHDGGLTVPTYGGRRGHPVCIDSSLREPLLDLPADVGLRGLFHGYPDRVKMVAVESGGILIDLDTPADYERYRALAAG